MCKGKRHVKVLIGDSQNNIGEGIEALISEEYDSKVITTSIHDEIVELAQNYAFDIFILILNNIHGFTSNNHLFSKRIDNVLQLVTHLKTTYRKPVVALSGVDSLSLEGEAKLAGVDLYFTLPFKTEEFIKAIKDILKIT